MKRRLQTLWSRLPRRRRRLWRYVSPRRRGAGVILLALLVAMFYGYWYVTNDRRIRKEAASYLRDLTGLNVSVKDAHFSLFGAIELRGVKLVAPGQASREPFIYATRILLDHRPQKIFTSGRLSPEGITLVEPVVTLEYDARSEEYNVQKIVEVVRSRQGAGGGGGAPDVLPIIRVLDGRLRVDEVNSPRPHMRYEEPLNMTMVPERERYRITFEGEREAGSGSSIQGTAVLNVATGRIEQNTGRFPIRKIYEAMPEKYRQWMERYGIRGDRVEVSREMTKNTVVVRLVNLGLKLPDSEGGLELTEVNGELLFDEAQVRLSGISGRLVQAGGAQFQMSGTYAGYEANSPFRLMLSAQKLDVGVLAGPEEGAHDATWLAQGIGAMKEILQPSGLTDMRVEIWRDAEGKTQFRGDIEPRGMSATLNYFPYRLDDLEGLVRFDTETATLERLKARHGAGSFDIRGSVQLKHVGKLDVTVDVADVELKADLAEALPEKFRRVWGYFRPGGTGSGQVHIHRAQPGENQKVDVRMVFDGRGAATYFEFPYPLENLAGELEFSGDRAELKNLTARRGEARCRINGTVAGLTGNDAEVELTIAASHVPIDDVLLNALPRRSRDVLQSLEAGGFVQSVDARIHRPQGGPLDYTILTTIGGMRYRFRDLPYAVTDAAGVVSIRPKRVEVQDLAGRHGDVPVRVSGQVFLDGPEMGMDLQIQARNAPLDAELYEALPRGMQGVWRDLAPTAGRADIRATFRQNVPASPEATDYRLEMDVRDVTLKYVHFPYALRGVSGRVTAVPGLVVLGEETTAPGQAPRWNDLTAAWGQTRAQLHGKVVTTENSDRIDLAIRASNVPVDAELLDALPEEMAPLAKQIVPQGTCGFDLSRLTISRTDVAAASQPATTTTAPTQPASNVTWQMVGKLSFQNAILKLGFDPKTLTGSIDGTAERIGDSIALDAQIALDSVEVENRRLTDFRGKARKGNGTVLRIDDLSAKANGGEIAGVAMIWLTEPLVYGVRLDVRQMQLSDLFPPGPDGKKVGIEGLLEGRISLTYTAGDPAGTSATGELTITEGKITKLPVMLDLLHVLPLAPPTDSNLTEAYLTYQLRGDTLTFEKIYLRGPGLVMKGSGTVDLKTRTLDLVFASGADLQKMGGLSELLGGIAANITGVRLTGTLEKPHIQSMTLSGLENAIRELYGAGQGGG